VTSGGGNEYPIGDRELIEDIVKLLLSEAPLGWTALHAEFEPAPRPSQVATASVVMGGAESRLIPVSAGVLSLLGEHHRRAVSAGAPWRRVVIDCQSDGRLSARAEPAGRAPGSVISPATTPPTLRRPARWPQWALATIAVGCLAAAATVFAFDWRWGPPPRAGIIAVPPPPPRQQEAFNVVKRWFDAENRSDAAAMTALMCAEPTKSLLEWVNTIKRFGQDQALTFPDAVTQFRDDGSRVWLDVAVSERPLDELQQLAFAAARPNGGFLSDQFTLADEGGRLRVCDAYTAPQ
jgi:hypothetical protein